MSIPHFASRLSFVQKYGGIFVFLSGIAGAFLLFAFLWMTLFFGVREASAAASTDPCLAFPLKGKTTQVLVNNVANSGVFYFDPASAAGVKETVYFAYPDQRPCALPVRDSGDSDLKTWAAANGALDDIALKGWVWNSNFGWTSLYCPGADGNNLGVYCGDQKYGVTIDPNGNFRGYAWSQVGWIRFRCAPTQGYGDSNHCAKSNYGVSADLKSLDKNGYASAANSYAATNTVGWMHFKGLMIPVKAKSSPIDQGPFCKPGDISCPVGCKPDLDGDGFCTMTPAITCPGSGGCPGGSPGPDPDDNNPFVTPLTPPEIPPSSPDNPAAPAVPLPVDPAAATSGVTFNIPQIIGSANQVGDMVSVGGSVRSDVRNVIYRNVQKLKRGAQCGAIGSILSFSLEDDVFYCPDRDIVIDTMKPWNGRKTLIVDDGNVFINGDIIGADNKAQFGLIVLKKDLKGRRKGNVYISGRVRELKIQLYADGSLFPYDGSKCAGKLPQDCGDAALAGPGEFGYSYGFAKLGSGIYDPSPSDASLFGQLLFRGLLITHNTVGEYFDKLDALDPMPYYDGYGKKLLAPGDSATGLTGVTTDSNAPLKSQMYSFGYLRSLPRSAICKGSDFSKSKNFCAISWNAYVDQTDDSLLSTEKQKKISGSVKNFFNDSNLNVAKTGVFLVYESPADDLPGFGTVTESVTKVK